MSWTRIDDQWRSSRKVAKAGPEACGFWLAMCCYSASYLTDGLVPDGELGLVFPGCNRRRAARLVRELVAAGMVERQPVNCQLTASQLPVNSQSIPSQPGIYWRIHDFLDYNASREEVLEKRALARRKKRRQRKMSPGDSPLPHTHTHTHTQLRPTDAPENSAEAAASSARLDGGSESGHSPQLEGGPGATTAATSSDEPEDAPRCDEDAPPGPPTPRPGPTMPGGGSGPSERLQRPRAAEPTGPSVVEQIRALEFRFGERLSAEARDAVGLSRRRGKVADPVWLRTLQALDAHGAPAASAAMTTFVESYGDGDKGEAYLIAIARNLAAGRGRQRRITGLARAGIGDFGSVAEDGADQLEIQLEADRRRRKEQA